MTSVAERIRERQAEIEEERRQRIAEKTLTKEQVEAISKKAYREWQEEYSEIHEINNQVIEFLGAKELLEEINKGIFKGKGRIFEEPSVARYCTIVGYNQRGFEDSREKFLQVFSHVTLEFRERKLDRRLSIIVFQGKEVLIRNVPRSLEWCSAEEFNPPILEERYGMVGEFEIQDPSDEKELNRIREEMVDVFVETVAGLTAD